MPRLILLALLAAAASAAPRLEVVGVYESGPDGGCEIVGAHAATHRAVVSHARKGVVDLLDLGDLTRPVRLRRFMLGLFAGEELTAVAFHPDGTRFLALVRGRGPTAKGRIEVRSVEDGALLTQVATGIGPDAITIDAAGLRAVIANEAEGPAPGSVTIVGLKDFAAREVALPDLSGRPGFTSADDGRIATGGADPAPLREQTPAALEPESVAISPDGRRAYVTLQENNGVAVIDLETAEVVACHGLGTTEHEADVTNDGKIVFEAGFRALREPDGIAVTPDGRFLVTADEGDSGPKAGETVRGKPAGGGRTVSVFEAATGKLMGDTGNGLDAAAAAAGLYRDDRSENRGSEPEGLVVLPRGDTFYAVVGLERADAVALVSLDDPRSPTVLSVLPLAPGRGPEGLFHYEMPDGSDYILVGCEGSGTVVVLRLRSEP